MNKYHAGLLSGSIDQCRDFFKTQTESWQQTKFFKRCIKKKVKSLKRHLTDEKKVPEVVGNIRDSMNNHFRRVMNPPDSINRPSIGHRETIISKRA